MTEVRPPQWPVSPATFAGFAAGGGGPDAIEQLAVAQRARRVTHLSQIVRKANAAEHPQRRQAAEARELLAAALEHDLGAAKEAVRHPSVGLCVLGARCWRCPAAGPGREQSRAGLCAIAAAAAIRAGLPAEIEHPG